MKICIEGPSAVGKTTLCKSLSPAFVRIPEVDELFAGEISTSILWYYDKQVERYQLSMNHLDSVFDSDIFQPLWYNWCYKTPQKDLTMKQVYQYYKSKIQDNLIGFPKIYFILYTSVEKLKLQKENDPARRRRNFTKHLQLIHTQSAYFQFLQKKFPSMVCFIENSQVQDTLEQINNQIDESRSVTSPDNPL